MISGVSSPALPILRKKQPLKALHRANHTLRDRVACPLKSTFYIFTILKRQPSMLTVEGLSARTSSSSHALGRFVWLQCALGFPSFPLALSRSFFDSRLSHLLISFLHTFCAKYPSDLTQPFGQHNMFVQPMLLREELEQFPYSYCRMEGEGGPYCQ